MSSSKKKKSSLASVVIGFFLVIIALVSFGISTFFSIKKHFKGDNYNSVINVRYELDPYKSENPAIDKKPEISLEELKFELDKTADAYSKYLLDKKVSSENVKTEIIEKDDGYHAFIDASLYNYKVETSDPGISNKDDKNKDVALSLAYYSNMDIGRFSIIYSDGYKDKFDESKLYMWDINQDDDYSLTDDNSKIKLNAQQNKINIKLRSQYSFGKKDKNDVYAKNSIKETFSNAKDAKPDEENDKTPFMIIIHNFNGMINEMNYITYVRVQYNRNLDHRDEVRDAYWQLSDDQREFGKYMQDNGFTDHWGFIDNYRFTDNYGFQKNIRDPLEQKELLPQADSVTTFDSSNFFYALQDTGSDNKIEIGKSSNLKYDFLNKYILGIVNKDNFTDFLPDKDPTKSSIDSDGNWLSIPDLTNKYFTSYQLYKSMTDQKSLFPMINILCPSSVGSKDEAKMLQNGITSNVNVSLINPDFDRSILQIDNASLTTLIAIAVLLLIIGIVVSVLYRIPGFVSFAWMILPIGLLPLIMFLTGFGLSLCLLIGILIIMMVSSVSLFISLNKVRASHVNHKTLDQSIRQGFKHSLITVLDFHVISLIAGITMLFFPMGQIFALGMCLIVGSLLSFACTYGLNYLNQIMLFNNDIGMYKFKWFSANVYDVNSNEYDKKFEISASDSIKNHIYSGLNKNGYISKITNINNLSFKKQWLIPYALIAVALIVIGFVLAFVLKIINLNSFNIGTYLIINRQDGITKDMIMRALNSLNASWFNFKTNIDYFTIESSTMFSIGTNEYTSLVNALVAIGINSFFVQNINSQITINFTINCLWILLTFGALMSVYTLIRYNWYSIIPTFASFILTCALTFALVAMFHIPVNIYTNYAFIMIGIINYLLMYALISSFLSKYIKINPTLYKDLQSLYIYTITTFNECSIEIITLYSGITLLMLLLLPTTTIFFTLNILIGIVVMVLNTYIILPIITYVFNNWHNMYRIRVRRIQLATDKNNLDKIDEELIDSININTRKYEKD